MNIGVVTTINPFSMIIIILVLAQWSLGESTDCTVQTTSVMCKNSEGNFLTNVRSENIEVINIMKSTLIYLTEQDFSKFTKVSEIIIDTCEIPPRVLNYILALKNLKVLRVNHCNITENYFPSLRNSSTLVILSLKSNKLVGIKKGVFQHFSRLEEIYLSGNEIIKIEAEAFQGLPALRKLDISFNGLGLFKNKTSIKKGLFYNLSRLEEINLSLNKIRYIDSDVFHGLSTLKKLDISFNFLGRISLHTEKGVFYNLSRLEEIDLSWNEITEIEPGVFQGLSALRRLNLSRNWLGGISLEFGKGVLANLPRLEEIDLSYNGIWTIEADAFQGLPSLKKLILSNNPGVENSFKNGVFRNLTSLEEIDLSHNHILSLKADAFQGLSALRKLNISHNYLGMFKYVINKGVFNNLSSLEEIDLSYNWISSIESDAFEGLPSLRMLDLSHNKLSDDFDPASLTLPAGCNWRSLVARCSGATMNDHPSEEHQRPAPSTTTGDLLQKQQEQQQHSEQLLNQQEGQQQHSETQVNEQEGQQQHSEQQVNEQEEKQQQEQQQLIKLQQKLRELQEQFHQQQQMIHLLKGELERLKHSEEDGGRKEDVGREGIAINASGDSDTGNSGGSLSWAMVGVLLLLNLVCTLLLLALFEAKIHKRILATLFRKGAGATSRATATRAAARAIVTETSTAAEISTAAASAKVTTK